MAIHKPLLKFVSPLIFHGRRHTFQQSRTFASPNNGLFKGLNSAYYSQMNLPRTYYYHHTCLNYSPILRNQVSCRKLSNHCFSNVSKKFQGPDLVSSMLCIPHISSKSSGARLVQNNPWLPWKMASTYNHSSAWFGDVFTRCKHTDSKGTSTDVVKPTQSEHAADDEGVQYKEVPLLFQHKTKKPRNVVKILRGLKSEGTKEKTKTPPGMVDLGTVRADLKAVDLKKRIKKTGKRVAKTDMLMCYAYATAEFYYLDKLKETMVKFGKYQPVDLPQDADGVLYMHLVEPTKDLSHDEPTEILFFEEGAVVLWNATPDLVKDILWILEYHQRERYQESTIHEENELINYRHQEKETSVNNKGVITFDTRDPKKLPLEKFAISNAIMHSVKLAMWENSLDQFVDSIEYIPEYMSVGKPIPMSREEVMKKRGKLFALRHRINLSSDLLIANDFYWDRDDLETLYQKMCHFFSIDRRTKVMNEKLNHCSELVELMRTTLSEKHSTRLEWMIIILIAVEVVFEFIHYIKLYFIGDKQSAQEKKSSQKSTTLT